MSKRWKIEELEPIVGECKLQYTDDSGNVNELVLTNSDLNYSLRRYGAWTFIDHTGSLKADVLLNNFNAWWRLNSDRFNHIFRAFNERYNPLENYLKHGHVETTRNSEDNNEDNIASRKAQTTPSNITTLNSERSADGSQLGTTNKAETTATNTTATTDAYKDTHKNTNSYHELIEDSTHGNIGTTRADEMLLGEVTARQYVLCDMIIDNFVYDNAFYVMEDLF